jgi:hydrogenase-4 component B
MLGVSPLSLYFICLGILFAGAIVCLLIMKNDRLACTIGNGAAALAAIISFVASLGVLLGGGVYAFATRELLPHLAISIRIDRLAAFFILVISLIAFFASLYGFGYVKHYFGKYNIGKLGFFYNLFIMGMLMVAGANDAFFFLIAWEIMSLCSYFLVVYESDNRNNVSAGTLYFIMTHVGTAFIILAFLLLYGATGSFDFSVIKNGLGSVAPIVKNAVFVLCLIGFGTKAGIIPFHIWLPSAHPAAPTHVSALMSGVMIKTGILMMIRVFIDFLPNPPLWWGVVVLSVGAVSALLGVLYALTEHDIKRLLAYHSIENIGIIMLGLGSAMVFSSLGMYPLAILALVASLFHTLNHAVFKSLLFLGAGAVINETHTRNMEEYGGLIKFMPQTALFFLVGSMAISALPPFNGFASEWATYQALFGGIMATGMLVRLAFIFAAGSLVFTGGLAAACFVKAFGATFLARPRSEEVKHAKDPAALSRFAMAALALIALSAGVFAGNVMNVLKNIATSLGSFGSVVPSFSATTAVLSTQNGFSAVSLPLVLVALLAAVCVSIFAVKIVSGKRLVKVGRTWDCGSDLNSRMEITATGFSRSIITVFKGVLMPTKQVSVEYRDADMRYFAKANTVKLGIKDIYGAYFYRPIQKLVTTTADKVKAIQGGNVNAYILYIFLTLIVLICILSVK